MADSVASLSQAFTASLNLESSKSDFRRQIWDLLESKDLVNPYPRPCHDKIPHFKNCRRAAKRASKLSEFSKAKVIKINPSLAQMYLRELALSFGKRLIVPNPSLENEKDIFYSIDGSSLSSDFHRRKASTKAGSVKYGTPLDLFDESLKIDMVVVGSVVASPNGARLGKGKGYADLEWGILTEVGAIDPSTTTVVTTVHEAQVRKLPLDILSEHDVTVDIIVTPNRIINVRNKLKKPDKGIVWDLVTEEMMNDIPILKKFKK